jgi:mono/diheme cytochrome c family protein
MDFPIFHLDFFGDRMLVAFIAILHVLINHAMAVGALPLVTSLEWWGWRKGDENWDRLVYKLVIVFFIVTTSVGALTGVGIWFSTSLVNPYAIGSLIRIFFWVWFAEWVVFVVEVSLLLVYVLLWKRWTGDRKPRHIRTGFFLSVASFCTLVPIVSILSYIMDPGLWRFDHSLFYAFFSPVYMPQLLFRFCMAMILAGALSLFLVRVFTKSDHDLRTRVVRFISLWILAWAPPFAFASLWYYDVVPKLMIKNLPVALATVEFQNLYSSILKFIVLSLVALAAASLWGAWKPSRVPRWTWAALIVLVVILTGQFERAREFIRKPYMLGGYMYASGIRVSDYPLLMTQGILPNSEYVSSHKVTPDNHLQAGKDIFMVACSRCHTLNGLNNMPARLRGLYGNKPWNAKAIDTYISTIHGARPFMPPFPGTARERRVLAEFLASLQTKRYNAEGAQTVGVPSGRE